MSVGNRLHFVEIGDYASAGDQPAHRLDGNLTIEAWVRLEPTTTSPMRGGIVTKLYTDGGEGHHGGYGLLRADNSYLLFYVAGSNLNLAQAACLPGDSAWHHVAGVYDGTSLALYVDGKRQAKRLVLPNSSPPVYRPNTELFIGKHKYGPDNPFPDGINGSICEVRVWSCARSEDELIQSMDSRLSGSETNLVGYWPLDEGVGSQGHDLCGTAPLTISGARWKDSGLPFAGSSGQGGARHTSGASTTSMLSAALESLNRRSAISLMDQLVNVLQSNEGSHTSEINRAKTELAEVLATTVQAIKITTNSLKKRNTLNKNDIDTLEGEIDSQITRLANDLDTQVTQKLDAQATAITQVAAQKVVPQVAGVLEEVLEKQNLANLSEEVSTIQESLDNLVTYANSLSAQEIETVAGVIDNAIMSMDLAPIIETALISVNGSLVHLNDLAHRLAAKSEVEHIDLTYDDENIRSAVFSFADGTSAVFTANRIDLPNLAVHYKLRTANLQGFPAEFELRFERTSRRRVLGDSEFTFDEYEPVYQSQVLYAIKIP